MDRGILTKYSASAGSGKTTALTRNYLHKLFSSRNSYRKILAVTFTNKASSEMKSRILDQLLLISTGKMPSEIDRLSKLTIKAPEAIRSEAKNVLENILHDYSRFYVGTIDSFFQKVLKAFTRESGLQSGYLIELDHSQMLSQAVDQMLSEIGDDKLLLEWVSEFAGIRVEEGKNWNIKGEIISLAEELFRENYKLLKPDEKEKLKDRIFLKEYEAELRSLYSEFKNNLRIRGNEIRTLLDKHAVTDDMFFQGKKGIPAFIKRISSPQIEAGDPLNSYIQKVLEDPPRFTTSPVPASQLAEALNEGFGQKIIEAVRFYNENFISVNTADAILSNIYSLGILSDVLIHIHSITTSENKFLLSDAGELLYLIIGNDQTPFIYEKIGNSFENYMIDEFQDTSVIQWKNFKPLIDNSMGEGFESIVVGDVKQSIYRWRNSDWKIFDEVVDQEIGKDRVRIEKLDVNYRSRTNIVAFNNSVFSVIPGLLDDQLENNNSEISKLYSDALQKTGGKKQGGYISFNFISETEEEKFKDIVLGKLPGIIEKLQDNGYHGSDIGILVRWNNEGSDILKKMLDYRSSVDQEKKKRYNYDIISNESLILNQNPVVCFIISLLTWLFDPSDTISKALIFRNWLLATGKEISEADNILIQNEDNEMEKLFPEGYDFLLRDLRQLSLFESVEKIISFFSLGSYPGNSAYLNSFQDCVLDYSTVHSSGVPAFIEWWSVSGLKKSVVSSEKQDSIRVMTIHKSKGLQFRVVIIPFLAWQLAHDKNPTIWVKPEKPPFNKLGLVPIKYRKSLINSQFAKDFEEERFSSVVDNLNLVYVAFTRAVDCLIGFCPETSGNHTLSAGSILKAAFQCEINPVPDKPVLPLNQLFNTGDSSFSSGEIPLRESDAPRPQEKEVTLPGYEVNISFDRLKLKFHGENFLIALPEDQQIKLNYGRLMHDLFSLITTFEDVHDAIAGMVLEGKISEIQSHDLEKKIFEAISSPAVKEWFETGNVIIKETDILLPTGSTKRPDRIILKNERAIIVDFKFGIEKPGYIKQVNNYKKLMGEMGHNNVEGFIWYVDINKIVSV
jgi:ATP-dependent helicase/nuclease subunit A